MLFNGDLGIARNQSELDEILRKYFASEYDPLYVCLATRVDFETDRQWLEAMWIEYQHAQLADLAEKDFVREFKKNCYQRAWELYLGITLHRKWRLEPGSKSGGPDFRTIQNTYKGPQTVWIEATSVERGNSPDRVPEMTFDMVAELPEDLMLLRLTQGLSKKYQKCCTYIKNGKTGINDPYIIAINRSEIGYSDPQIPLILKCLFRLKHQILLPQQRKLDAETTESFWTTRDFIPKGNGSSSHLTTKEQRLVSMDFFDNPAYSEISAVIYVDTGILDSTKSPKEMGNNFTIVLNPYAKNECPRELLTFGNVWQKEGNSIHLIRSSKRV